MSYDFCHAVNETLLTDVKYFAILFAFDPLKQEYLGKKFFFIVSSGNRDSAK